MLYSQCVLKGEGKIIKHFIQTGTKIITYEFQSCKTSQREDLCHEIMYHSVDFISSDNPSVHTQLYLLQYLYVHYLKLHNINDAPDKLTIFL